MNRRAFFETWVVVGVIGLLFAAAVMFGIYPKLGKAPGLLEVFFPEKCEQTGKARSEYLSLIATALKRTTGADEAVARKFYIEMKQCFPDSDIPNEDKVLLFRAIHEKLKSLAQATKYQQFSDIVKIYDESKPLVSDKTGVASLDVWNNDDLLIFARGMYHVSRPEALDLANYALTRDLTPVQMAEALTIQDIFSSISVGLVTKGAEKIVKEFEETTDTELLLYVGLARRHLAGRVPGLAAKGITGKPISDREAAISALQIARSSSSPYTQHVAMYWLAFEYWQQGLDKQKSGDAHAAETSFKAAAILYEKIINEQKGAIHTGQAEADYASIGQQYRSIKDCALNVQLTATCSCFTETRGPVLLPLGSLVYCCSKRPSDKPCDCVDDPFSEACACKTAKDCDGYKTQALCEKDPCGFAGSAGRADWDCVWRGPDCYTKYYGAD